jgi:hypothetical protein
MLNQIPWHAYVAGIIILLIVYYLYVGLVYYRSDLEALIYRFTGRRPAIQTSSSLIPVPDYEIMGSARPEYEQSGEEDQLEFGPPEIPDEEEVQVQEVLAASPSDAKLIGEFSEMVSEVKTLIRVINESCETRENFEMLYKLIIQKYSAVAGTSYQQKINDFLLEESAGQFPFELTSEALEEYWLKIN